MAKTIMYDIEALIKLKQGVEKMTKAIRTTYGPGGRNVIFKENGRYSISKDGSAVAENIDLQDPFENMGAQLIRQVSKQTAENAGDGTTTVAILTGQLLTEGMRLVASGSDPIKLQSGINKAHCFAVKALAEISRPVNLKEDLINIATIAVNNDVKSGKLIAEAFKTKGKETIVHVQESKGVESTIEFVEGIEIKGGFLSSNFVTDTVRNEAVLENALVLITDKRISSVEEIVPILTKIVDSSKPVLIIAKDFDTDVLDKLVANNRNYVIQCIAVKSNLAGLALNELLEDISLVTDTEVFTEEKGQDLKEIPIIQLGTVDKVVVSSTHTRIISGKDKTPRLESLISILQKRRNNNYNRAELANIETRLARLTDGVAIISIGATTETELKEKLYRVEDGIKAVKAALEEGVVAGGGMVWLHLVKHIEEVTSRDMDEQKGIAIFKRALAAPFIALGENAGIEPLPLLEKMMQASSETGYDFRNDQVVNIWKAGIIDPAKVIKVAMGNAVSVVTELLKTKVAIAI